MKPLITIEEATVLLEKYYEGFTSAEEEKLLRSFLSQKDLPVQFEADRAILGYFASERKKHLLKQEVSLPSTKRHIPLWRWTGVAASIMIAITSAHFLLSGYADSYAYIDGKKITNIEQVKEQAFASINSWNSSDIDSDLDTEEFILQQLQLFIK